LIDEFEPDQEEKRARQPLETVRPATVAAVVCPYMAGMRGRGRERDSEAKLEEAVGLARAIDLDVRLQQVAPLRQVTPATLLGKGVVARIAAAVEEMGIGLVVVDDKLTPVQQRNLEKAWQAKVIDRTGLILEIFGARARTHEGRLQVELAALDYQRGRLVQSWTHLERQRGGFGFLGGPGESQIEIDRRLIGERIVRIKRDLESVRKTRAVNRAGRKKARLPTVALVGYTNAGKSTLFNALVKARAYAADQLFATLDTTTRQLYLGDAARSVSLSDTVGFIRDLPHGLIDAFAATLQEAADADLLLHVVDGANPDHLAQIEQVQRVLAEIGAADVPQILVFNKLDALEKSRWPLLLSDSFEIKDAFSDTGTRVERVFVSAQTGEGLPLLRQWLARHASQSPVEDSPQISEAVA